MNDLYKLFTTLSIETTVELIESSRYREPSIENPSIGVFIALYNILQFLSKMESGKNLKNGVLGEG